MFSGKSDLTIERSTERHLLVLLSSLSFGIAKIVALLASLITIPLTIKYLGVERFGLWMTISSAIAMVAFADLGIGNGLLNAVSNANGKNDNIAIKSYISSAIATLTIIALLVLIIFFTVFQFISWDEVFNVSSLTAAEEAGIATAIMLACFALSLPIGVVQRVQMGLQIGYVAYLWQILGSVLGLIATLVVISFQLGLPSLIIAAVGVPIVANLLNGIVFFLIKRRDLAPSIQFVHRDAVSKVFHTGMLFLVLQIAGLVAFQSDALIISHYLGPAAVAEYFVVLKLFSIPGMILSFYLMALWPAYGDAYSRGETNWIRDTYKKSLHYSLILTIPMTGFLVVFGTLLIEMWVGSSVSPSIELILGMGLWALLTVWGGNYSTLLNGLHVIKFQVITSVLMAVFNVFISIWLVKKVGISGAIFGSVLSLILVSYIPTHIYIKRRILANQ